MSKLIKLILKMNSKRLRSITTTAFFMAVCSNLHGQQGDAVKLDDLVVVGEYLQSNQVNALKTPTPINEVPQSLVILTSDYMSLQDITGMADIADYTPGIDAGQGEGHRDDILFRGVKSTADFFVDGVRLIFYLQSAKRGARVPVPIPSHRKKTFCLI